ncbi:uncharacterized protein LOC135225091 [Macrobrachium nipponense]|uniref:uncharacterized protein LOC135225091 n=1 Tax=Macrobrachium nipponense TaxID=159736 RepID=UPI0030C863AA
MTNLSRVRRRTRSVNVTFKDATSPRSASSRSPDSIPRRSLSHKRQDEAAGIEGDTDTDDELFQHSQSQRTRGQCGKNQKSVRKNVYMMNGDDLGDEGLVEDEIGKLYNIAVTMEPRSTRTGHELERNHVVDSKHPYPQNAMLLKKSNMSYEIEEEVANKMSYTF